MKKNKKISPSILAADFSRLGEEVVAMEKAGADYLHVDVMDGHFVPNITIGVPVVKALRKVTSLPLDVHLMIRNPDDYLDAFIAAGAEILTVHVETTPHLHRTLTAIRQGGIRAGLSLNPATPLCLIEPALDFVDLVLVMTVNPGFGGQELIPEVLSKIDELRRMLDRKKLAVEIEVDGGIKVSNIRQVAQAGADVFVSGSGIFQTPSYQKTIAAMREEIGKAGNHSPQRSRRRQRI